MPVRGFAPAARVDRQVAVGAVEPAGRVFRHAAGDQVSRACTPRLERRPRRGRAVARRATGSAGAEPAELVAKKVLDQRSQFAHAYPAIPFRRTLG